MCVRHKLLVLWGLQRKTEKPTWLMFWLSVFQDCDSENCVLVCCGNVQNGHHTADWQIVQVRHDVSGVHNDCGTTYPQLSLSKLVDVRVMTHGANHQNKLMMVGLCMIRTGQTSCLWRLAQGDWMDSISWVWVIRTPRKGRRVRDLSSRDARNFPSL